MEFLYQKVGEQIGLQTDYVNSKYVVSTAEEIPNLDADLGNVIEVLSKIQELKNIDLSWEEIARIRDTYFNVLSSNLTEDNFVKVSSSDVTGYQLNITGDELKNITLKLLETLQNDTETLDKINEYLKVQSSSNSITVNDIAKLIEDINNNQDILNKTVKITVYVNGGNLNRLEININENILDITKNKVDTNVGYNISFKGNILSSAIDGTATIIEKAGMSSFGEAATKTVSRFKKPSARMADLESIIITGYWVQNTLRSRKIEPSQKLGLNVHSILVTIVSSTAAFIIDWALDGLIDKSKENYSKKLKEIVNQIENKNSYRGIGSIIGNSSDAVKMAIEDEVVHLLDSKITPEGLKEITDGEITNILNKLKNMRTLEGFNLDKKTLNDVIVALGNTEPARKEILELSKNMIGSSDIAKQLSRVIGDNEDSINNVIKSLTKQYGKKLSKFKSLTIFTLVVRFLVPVLMVPFSGKLKKKIVEWQEKRAAEKNK